jgi:ABC-2 type transport system permease protein
MAFLSGTFFDINAAPGFIKVVSKALPLRWMNDGMLDLLVRDRGAEALIAPALVLTGFAVVVSLIATRLFTWDDA